MISMTEPGMVGASSTCCSSTASTRACKSDNAFPSTAPAKRPTRAPSKVRVSVYDSGIGRPPRDVETTIYYCCLESLQNAAKHAGSDAAVSIRLTRGDGRVRFSIEDDGAGFDPAAVVPGAGLTNMERRLAALGGRLEVDTRDGAGTRVTGDVPL